MTIAFVVFFAFFILFSVFKGKHRNLVFLVILSVFTDIFVFNLGSVVHLSNIVGFAVLPLIIRFPLKGNFKRVTSQIAYVFRPLWLNFFYLIILGFFFGFLVPWEDTGGYRTWSQQASGRTVVTLIRYFNEFCVAMYIAWVILSHRVNMSFILTVIGLITFISCSIGVLEYIVGFPLIKSFIQEHPKILPDRFLGLCGEPKSFGRNAALAYTLLLLYYLRVQKSRKLLLFIFINVLAVILSFSASTFILFIIFNIYLLISIGKLRIALLILPVFFFANLIINTQPAFEQVKIKMEKALFGSQDLVSFSYSSFSVFEKVISRFDIFDHLAYVFLLENPGYMITGTGPNLISLPASKYVGNYSQYSTYAELGGVDSVPNVIFNNVLAASGIIGVILFVIFFVRLYRFSKIDISSFSSGLVFIALIFSMVYFNIVLMFLTGVIVGIVCGRMVGSRSAVSSF